MEQLLKIVEENARISLEDLAVMVGDTPESDILGGIKEISLIEFKNADVVRHKLVGKILQAYDDAKR